MGWKWVYKVKLKSNGSIECHKAQLVAKGFIQTEGVDYFETFSSIAKLATVKSLFALTAIHNWFIA